MPTRLYAGCEHTHSALWQQGDVHGSHMLFGPSLSQMKKKKKGGGGEIFATHSNGKLGILCSWGSWVSAIL